jgi:hypothetical protein
MVHGQYLDNGYPANWLVADILRLQDGILVEHWDTIQVEAKTSASGRPMFGKHLSAHRGASPIRQRAFRPCPPNTAQPNA